jgi:hypothetical protein
VPRKRRPGPHPAPPADLATRALPVVRVAGPWFRIHGIDYNPLYFGQSGDNRFDSPPPGMYGVLYVAHEVDGAFIETLGHATGTNVLADAELRERGLARIRTRGPLLLVDLTGPGLAHLGADNRLCTGDIFVAQRWSRALHGHPDEPDGILYRSRHDPELLCAAIYDRARDRIQAQRLGSLLGRKNLSRVQELLRKYRFSLVP